MAPISSAPRSLVLGRFIKSMILGEGDPMQALAFASGQNWRDTPQVELSLKAAVSAMTTSAPGELTATPVGYLFSEMLRPLSLLGRMVGTRPVPFNVRTLSQAGGVTANWIGEGLPIPVSKADFDVGTTLTWAKVQSLSVHTKELARSSAPNVEEVLARDALRAAAVAIDSALVDADNAGTTAKPASISNGATTYTSGGSTAALIDADLTKALAVLNNATIDLASAYWLLAPRTAVYLSLLRGSGGALSYPTVTARGGTLAGIPVLTSVACMDVSSPTEANILLVAADEIDLADDGAGVIEISEQASLQLLDGPLTGAAQMVSLWQHGLVALRCTRTINWRMRHAAGCAVVQGCQF